jgi:preprotein translocase subunit YajC
MTFKKGDRVRTDEGLIGEILFIDRDGVEAQVALEKTSIKLRSDTLEKVSADAPITKPAPAKAKTPRKKSVKTP